jgi:hypothetical protein
MGRTNLVGLTESGAYTSRSYRAGFFRPSDYWPSLSLEESSVCPCWGQPNPPGAERSSRSLARHPACNRRSTGRWRSRRTDCDRKMGDGTSSNQSQIGSEQGRQRISVCVQTWRFSWVRTPTVSRTQQPGDLAQVFPRMDNVQRKSEKKHGAIRGDLSGPAFRASAVGQSGCAQCAQQLDDAGDSSPDADFGNRHSVLARIPHCSGKAQVGPTLNDCIGAGGAAAGAPVKAGVGGQHSGC